LYCKGDISVGIVNDVALYEVGIRINTQNAGWFDEDCRKAIKSKNKTRKKCIIRDTRINREEYTKRRNEARKISRDKKGEMINNEIKELEIENEKYENGKFYKKLEILTKTYKPRNRNFKARNGSELTDEKGILNRWNEHVRGEQSTQAFEFYENESYGYIEEEIEEPTLYEIQKVIINFKRKKTSGTDNINGELLQVEGPQMTQKIQELILNI
jgi:hypothetical protein